MAWKNLEQTTLVDAMLIDHAALRELDDVHELIDWSRAYSGSKLPPIPDECCHPFHFKAATNSG
jgi:hypothetical protein